MGRAPSFFPILGGLEGGGNPTIHIPPPILGTLNLSRILASPHVLRSGSDLRLSPNLPVTAELILGPVRADLASAVSSDRTHQAIVVSCRLLGRSELLLPTKKHAADCIRIFIYTSLGFPT